MKTTLRALSIAGTLAVGLATAIGLPQTSRAEVPKSQDPIKIALFDWTSVNVNAKIMGGILHRLGYNVDYVTADYLSSLTTGLTTGDIDIITEEWDTTAGDAMKASDATGQTERLGKLGPKAKEDWWYPLYMKEKCPGPAGLACAPRSEMRCRLLHRGHGPQGPLSRRTGDLGRL